MKLEYVIPSAGHSGSLFASKVMTQAGLLCGHELVYAGNEHNMGLRRVPAIVIGQTGCVAESSAFLIPYLRDARCADAKCIHLVRDPRNVVRSWRRRPKVGFGHSGFFSDFFARSGTWMFPELRQFMYDQEQQTTTWCMAMYVCMNRAIEYMRPDATRCRVEDGYKLLRYTSKCNEYVENTYGEEVNKKCDHDIPFECFSDNVNVQREFNNMITEYGYGI